jgi:hypothetical protein
MAGYRQDLGDIYTGITEGKQHKSDKKLSEMYREVISEDISDETLDIVGFEKQAAEIESDELYAIPGIDEVTLQKLLAARKHLIGHWIQNQCGYTDPAWETTQMVMGYLESWVDWTKLVNYVQSKAKNKNKLENHFKGNQGFVNIKDMIIKELISIGRDPNNAQLLDDTYVSLFSYAFPESTVSVGKGELILTLFTNAVKGTVGDLEYSPQYNGVKDSGGISTDTFQVEVKVGKGRAVSARGGMFKNANEAIENAVSGEGSTKNNKDFTKFLYEGESGSADSQLPKLKPFSRGAKQILQLLNTYDPNGTDLKLRHEVTLASLVWAYANPEDKNKGFSHLLLIYQAGKKASTAKNMNPEKGQFPVGTPQPGTLEEAWYLNCETMENVYSAIREGKLMLERGGEQEGGKKLQGDGVYVLYAGSNSEIGYQGVASTLRTRLSPEQQKIFDMGFNAANQEQ